MSCRICRSDYRGEIEALTKQKISRADISRKYYKIFDCSESNLYDSISLHVRKNHPPMIRDFTPLEKTHKPVTNFDEFANDLLIQGGENLRLHPEKITPNHVISAKRTQIEERKAKNQSDATKLMFLKFFRGTSGIVEGTVIDEPVKQIRGENLPTDTD